MGRTAVLQQRVALRICGVVLQVGVPQISADRPGIARGTITGIAFP